MICGRSPGRAEGGSQERGARRRALHRWATEGCGEERREGEIHRTANGKLKHPASNCCVSPRSDLGGKASAITCKQFSSRNVVLLPVECFSKWDLELSHTSLPLLHSLIPQRQKNFYLHPALKKKSIKPAALKNKAPFLVYANNLLLFQVLLQALSRAAQSPIRK